MIRGVGAALGADGGAKDTPIHKKALTQTLSTDHAMPGMTGTDLAVRLRAHDPRLPILLATGYAELQGELPIELPRLAKPYSQEQLSLEIARLLPEGRLQRG
jgi:DNA-binding LytR/AlgR family response regulator